MRATAIVRVLLGLALLAAGVGGPCAASAGDAPSHGAVHGIAMHGSPKYGADFRWLDYVNPDAPKGGTIRHAAAGSFDSLNPFIVRGQKPPGMSGAVVEALMARSWDEPFSLYGLIAETIATPDDRSWVEFTLRPQARWHDGRPITVDDVVFSFETLKKHGLPSRRRTHGKVTEVVRTGERSVRFVFDGSGDREMPLLMGLMQILPKHWWEARDITQTTLEPPLGSGPYRVAAADPGRSIVYERVADYWGKDLPINRGMNNFDAVRYDFYRDDGIAQEAFKAGAVDFRRESDPAKWVTSYDFPAARDGRVRMELLSRGFPEPVRALALNTRRPPFDDRRVREALNLAFDFEWMNKALFHGAYKRTASYFPNSELAHRGPPGPNELALLNPLRAWLPPEVFERPFTLPATDGSGPPGQRANLRRAQKLLAEAGWVVRDGRMVNAATGAQMAFEILLNGPADERVALEYARSLGRLGIDASVRIADSAQYQGRIDQLDFDATTTRWISTLSPGTEQLTYWSSAVADQRGTRNLAGVRSPAVDALAAGLGEARTREELVARTRALDRALSWGWYVVPLYHLTDDRVAYWTRIQRPAVTPVFGLVIEAWWAGGE
ncbi:MAG TPA: extracellular solute-binding protein [Azospirillaceae bacterium]|nr:extracellular solute-binding protein [Azospirillaceae bacterium]